MNDYLETFSIYFKVYPKTLPCCVQSCTAAVFQILVLSFSTSGLQVLQSHANVVSCSHLSGEMEKLHVHYVHVNLELKNGGGANSTTGVYADDIETESNSYFHQLFSGQLTIDTMIQMLGRFKASPGKRSIFLLMFVFSVNICTNSQFPPWPPRACDPMSPYYMTVLFMITSFGIRSSIKMCHFHCHGFYFESMQVSVSVLCNLMRIL